MTCEIAIGGNYYREFVLKNATGPNQGLPVNADSLPVIEIRKNGIINTDVAPVVTNLATGQYSVVFTIPATWNILDVIDIFVTFSISSTSYRRGLEGFTVVGVFTSAYNPSLTVTRAMVEMIYGAANVARWADADNLDNQTTITNRIAWAIYRADLYVEGKLSLLYTVPMNPIPALVSEWIAERAGIELYISPRGLVEGSDETAVMESRIAKLDQRIGEAVQGLIRFLDVPTTFTTTPQYICETFQKRLDSAMFDPLSPYEQIEGVFVPLPESLWYQT